VGTWTAPAPAEGAAFSNHTLRMNVGASLGGDTLRVRLSNAHGSRKLVVGDAFCRWLDQLSRRLQARASGRPMGVMNQGLGGNRILHDIRGDSGLRGRWSRVRRRGRGWTRARP
jgi:hypothetical protein